MPTLKQMFKLWEFDFKMKQAQRELNQNLQI